MRAASQRMRRLVSIYTYKVVQDLVPNDAHHFETLLAADRVDDHVAVNANKVL